MRLISATALALAATVLPASFAAAAPAAPELSGGGSTLKFAPAKDGFGCASLARGGSSFFCGGADANTGLWRLVFRAGAGGKEIAVDATKATGRCERRGSGLSFLWKRVDIEKGDGALDVRCDVDWKEESGRYEFTIKVDNRSSSYGLYSTEYPRLRQVVKAGSGSVIFPGGNWGGLRRLNSWRQNQIYPGYPAPLQMTIFETGGVGLLVAALDPDACIKTLSLDEKFNFSFVAPAVQAGVPGAAGAPTYPVALYPYTGTWWKAAKHYRKWAVSSASWMKAGKSRERADYAKRFRNAGLWLLLNSKSNTVDKTEAKVNNALELVKGRVPLSVHWYCWHKHTFDTLYPEFFPTQPGFAEAAVRLEKKGVMISPYINGRLWDCAHPGYAAVKKYACRKEDGSPCNETWNKREFSAMCQSTPLWRDTLVDVADRLFSECGVGSLYLDQIASMKAVVCYADDHGHPVGGGSHWVDGYKDIVRRIRRDNPGKPITSENFSEPYVDVFEGFLTWSPNATNDIPLLPAVYSGYCESFGCRTAPSYTMEAFRAAHGRSFLWGCQPGWESEWIFEKKYRDRFEYLVHLAELRATAQEFFADGEYVADVDNLSDNKMLKLTWLRWGKPMLAEVPAVQATLWEAADGSRMVAVANYSDAPRKFSCKYLGAPIDLKAGEVRLVKIGKPAEIASTDATARYSLDETTGGIASLAAADGRQGVASIENVYQFMSRPGDVTALERDDRVVSRKADGDAVTFTCVNPKMPDVRIEKRYSPCRGGLRRTLAFDYTGSTNVFVLTFTECRFHPQFLTNAWHLGAGYIGPYKPFPRVEKPRQVNEFRQSSKGMLLVNPDGRTGCFSHYRRKINDIVVLPWWHSTIGHYREYADRLWYLPDGYRMGLGTLDLKRGKRISVSDTFNLFDGNAFTFFDKVFGADEEVMAEIRAIPPQPEWTSDVFTLSTIATGCLRELIDMSDDGIVISGPSMAIGGWCDYRPEGGFTTYRGGHMTGEEMREFVARQTAVSDRIRPSVYNIVISASVNTDILKEHPEWFRFNDRGGNTDSLFPGLLTNYQTMFCSPECRTWIVDSVMRFANYAGLPIIYIDEAQMTSTIDWDREIMTRDDHTVLFWRELAARASKEGKVLFFNGSGLPYASLNYMESPHELAPSRWRDWVGVAWGIGMMNRFRPANRTSPLYWGAGRDYVNRILALGWLPQAGYPRANVVPTLRAVYESGALVPIDARYTPDWKGDWNTQVESHAMTRTDGTDKLLSFINRAHSTNDVPVSVDLDSLGFGGGRINIWQIGLQEIGLPGRAFVLSDREAKENWRRFRWNDGVTTTRPRLVYSGPSTGSFKTVLRKLGTDVMEQLLVTAGPAGFYAVDGLPCNYFYTVGRKGRIDGGKVSLKAPADIVLAGLGLSYGGVTTNGAPVKTSVVDVGGTLCTVASLAAGEWNLAWTESQRPAVRGAGKPLTASVSANGRLDIEGGELYAIERNGVTVHTGTSPVSLPAKRANGDYRIRRAGDAESVGIALKGGGRSSVNDWRISFSPALTNVVKVSARHGDVAVTEKAEFIGRHETTLLGMDIPAGVAVADERKLTIEAGTSRREGNNIVQSAWAGLELKGAKKVKLRLDHTFAEAFCIVRGHADRSLKPELIFTGIMVDYGVGGRYAKRVSMSMGHYSPKYAVATPHWGTGKAPDSVLELGDFVNERSGRVFSLDLAALAPKDWDGRVYLSVGTERIFPGRRLKLTVLGLNDQVRDGFVVPSCPEVAGKRKMPAPAMSKPLKKPPASLAKINAAEWKGWTELEPFQLNGTDENGVLKAKTRAWLAHDYDYVYIGVEASERRKPVLNSTVPAGNDHLEVIIVRPEGSRYQVIADAKSGKTLYVNAIERDGADKVVVRGEVVPGVGYRMFFAIPVNELKFDMQRTPVRVKGDFFRVRVQPDGENSAWAPLPGAFNDAARYGELVFDFNW